VSSCNMLNTPYKCIIIHPSAHRLSNAGTMSSPIQYSLFKMSITGYLLPSKKKVACSLAGCCRLRQKEEKNRSKMLIRRRLRRKNVVGRIQARAPSLSWLYAWPVIGFQTSLCPFFPQNSSNHSWHLPPTQQPAKCTSRSPSRYPMLSPPCT
jgi:hypothetical protein